MAKLNPEETLAAYDFIVVGAGPAGSSVARGLASSNARPKVLLVEAGGDNSDPNLRVAGNQFVQFMDPTNGVPYESSPQAHMDGRRIGLARGKGLGGSSSVNFTAWTVGPRDDMDHMADITGDAAWRWEHALRRWKQLENYHNQSDEVPRGMQRYLDSSERVHGHNGPLHIAFGGKWDHYITKVMDIWNANGFPINTDLGSGEHLGVSVVPRTSYRGTRTTAADVLFRTSDNLHILTNSPVARVVLDDSRRAIGIELLDGRIIRAKNEVVLSAGSLDTPRILMHSGIGPADQLDQFNIPKRVVNPHVGQHYKDHYHAPLKYARTEHNDTVCAFFRDKVRQAEALREWQLYRTGEYVTAGTSLVAGFHKLESVTQSKEFADLPEAEQARIRKPTIPIYEMAAAGITPEYYTEPDTTPPILTIMIFVHNTQAEGDVRLASADPAVPLEFNTSFMTHPYDRRVILDATREVMRVTASAAFLDEAHPKRPTFDVPASDSDDDILSWWLRNCTSTWHMSGTCRIAKSADEGVVDSRLRVFGVQGLRVVDLSVMPIIVSTHTQATAYQVGMLAAEKLTAEYSLNGYQRL